MVKRLDRDVVGEKTPAQGIEQQVVDNDQKSGQKPRAALAQHDGSKPTAVVIQQPNLFGVLEDVDAITDWAHAQGALVIAVVNPTSLAVLKAPGQWGTKGADIVCGEEIGRAHV